MIHFRTATDDAGSVELEALMNQEIRDFILPSFEKASVLTNVVMGQARLYYQVSAKHIMPKINHLPELMALDPDDDKAGTYVQCNYVILAY